MKKRIFAYVIAVLVIGAIIALGAFPAFAEEPEAYWGADKDNLTESGDLVDAFASDSEYILLNKDIPDMSVSYYIQRPHIFDFNGHSLRCEVEGEHVLWVHLEPGEKFTVIDSVGGGKATSELQSALRISEGILTVEGGEFVGHTALQSDEYGSVIISGGVFRGKSYSTVFALTDVTISGGTFYSSPDSNIYCGEGGSVKITGGKFEDGGNTGDICVEGGTADLSEHADPLGISVSFYTSGEVLLPPGYVFKDEGADEKSAAVDPETMEESILYVIEKKRIEAKWGTSADALTNEGALYEAAKAVKEGEASYIRAEADIHNANVYIIPAAGSEGITFDINGKTLTSENNLLVIYDSNNTDAAVTVIDSASGGKLDCSISGCAVNVSEGKLIIKSGEFISTVAAVCVEESGSALIKGGTFTSTPSYALLNYGNTVIEGGVFTSVNDYTLCHGGGTTVIKGGSFIADERTNVFYVKGKLDLSQYPEPADISVTTYDLPVTLDGTTVVLPEGYCFFSTEMKVAESLNAYSEYTVGVKPAEAFWGASVDALTSKGSLAEAFAAANAGNAAYIRLGRDLTVSGIEVNGGSFVLDLHGFDITGEADLITVNAPASITVTDTSPEKGALIAGDYAIKLNGGEVKLQRALLYSNNLNAATGYCGGKLDLTGLEIYNAFTLENLTGGALTVGAENILLPQGWYFMEYMPLAEVTTLEADGIYILDKIIQAVYKMNDGTDDHTEVTTTALYCYQDAPEFTGEGYYFKGFATDAEGENLIDMDYVAEGDITLYAVWEKIYPVYIFGIGIGDGEYLPSNGTSATTEKPQGGYAYYENGVLTLSDFVFEAANPPAGESIARSFIDPNEEVLRELTLKLAGDSKFTDLNGMEICGIELDNCDLTVEGRGNLTFNDVCYGFYVTGSKVTVDMSGSLRVDGGDIGADLLDSELVIENGTVVLDVDGSDTIGLEGSHLTVNGGSLSVYCRTNADAVDGTLNSSVTVNGGMVYLYSEADNGIDVEYGKIKVTGGLLIIEADDEGIYCSLDVNEEGVLFPASVELLGGEIFIWSGSEGIQLASADLTVKDCVLRIISVGEGIDGWDMIYTDENGNDIYGDITIGGEDTVIYIYSDSVAILNVNDVLLEDAFAELDLTLTDGYLTAEDGSLICSLLLEKEDTGHNWSERYVFDGTGHWHECTDNGCIISGAELGAGAPAGAEYGYHDTLGENGGCSVCGFDAQLEELDVSCYTNSIESTVRYDGTPKTVEVTGPEGCGEITVIYYTDYAMTEKAEPVEVGIYYVAVTVTAGDRFGAVTLPIYIGQFEIIPAIRLSGKVNCIGEGEGRITVTLSRDGEAVATAELEENGEYFFELAEIGRYTLSVSKTKYATREYTVDISEDTVLDVEILLYGDVNGDGKVNAGDATQIKRYYNNKTSVFTAANADTEYLKKVADVNMDNKANAGDATQIKRYYNNKTSVFINLP